MATRYGDGAKPKRSSTGWYSPVDMGKDPIRKSPDVDNSGNPTGKDKVRQADMSVLDKQQLAGRLPRKS
jgi:hypothetical protein